MLDNYGLSRESIALALVKLGRYAEALEYYALALAYRSERAYENIYMGMARCSAGLNDMAGSIKHLEKAVARNPNNYVAHVNLGSYYGRMGNLRGALREYRLAQRIKPGDANVARMVQMLEKQLGGGGYVGR